VAASEGDDLYPIAESGALDPDLLGDDALAFCAPPDCAVGCPQAMVVRAVRLVRARSILSISVMFGCSAGCLDRFGHRWEAGKLMAWLPATSGEEA
jgi:uncharacterized glyoxalase superfamily protein PhnB